MPERNGVLPFPYTSQTQTLSRSERQSMDYTK